jgi:hypothetical protein
MNHMCLVSIHRQRIVFIASTLGSTSRRKPGLLPVIKQSVDEFRDPKAAHMNQCQYLGQSKQDEYSTA